MADEPNVIVEIVAYERVEYVSRVGFDTMEEANAFLEEHKQSRAWDFIDDFVDRVLDASNSDEAVARVRIKGHPDTEIELD